MALVVARDFGMSGSIQEEHAADVSDVGVVCLNVQTQQQHGDV